MASFGVDFRERWYPTATDYIFLMLCVNCALPNFEGDYTAGVLVGIDLSSSSDAIQGPSLGLLANAVHPPHDLAREVVQVVWGRRGFGET